MTRQAGNGNARIGKSPPGMAGKARHGMDRRCPAWRVTAGGVWHGVARRVTTRFGSARSGKV